MKKRQGLHGCFKINNVFSSVLKTPLMKSKQKKMHGCSAINFNLNVWVARCLTIKMIWNYQILLARQSEIIVAEVVYIILIIIIVISSHYWDETYNYADTFTNNTHLKP